MYIIHEWSRPNFILTWNTYFTFFEVAHRHQCYFHNYGNLNAVIQSSTDTP